MAKNIFIAATGKDVGKSTVSFAFISKLCSMNKNVAFMKPVGQRWLPSKWGEVEEDVILMKEAFKLPDEPKYMNPVVIKKGYTEDYLTRTIKPDLSSDIIFGYRELSKDKDYVIIEGTGHAGVGSVVDHSNADVAAILDAKVVLLAKGGIGNTIDRLELNRVFFEKRGVEVIGVIINKVIESKYEKVKDAIEIYCKEHKLKLFGVIPYSTVLNNPTLGTVIEELNPVVLKETEERNVVIDEYLVGASNLKEAIAYMKQIHGNILLILPSERIDIILSIPNIKTLLGDGVRILALLLTGHNKPDDDILKILEKEQINILWKKGDTYSVISKLSKISIKTRAIDNYKIDEIQKIVLKNIDFKSIFSRIRNAQIAETTIAKTKTFFADIINFFKKLWGKIGRKKNEIEK